MPDAAAKIALRNHILTSRRSLTQVARAAADAAVRSATVALLRDRRPRLVTAYVPVGTEPGGADLPGALLAALPPGGRLLLPVLLADGDLDWAPYTGPDSLRPGPRGLREPATAPLGPDAVAGADLLVVPALAVDRAGHRLGRGGGSYDRALARTDAPAVALLHDGELRDAVPALPHDRPVAAVVTPGAGLVHVGGTAGRKGT